MYYFNDRYATKLTELISSHSTKEFSNMDYEFLYGSIKDMLSNRAEVLWNAWSNNIYKDKEYYGDFSISDMDAVFDIDRIESIFCDYEITMSYDLKKKLVVCLDKWLKDAFKMWEHIQDDEYLIAKWNFFCGYQSECPF